MEIDVSVDERFCFDLLAPLLDFSALRGTSASPPMFAHTFSTRTWPSDVIWSAITDDARKR